MVRLECIRENRKPVIAGPKNPPRFPPALMKPMEAARAERVAASVGNSQKAGCQAKAAAPVSESQTNVSAAGWFGIAVNPNKTPAASMGKTVCFLASPLRSQERPASHVESMASPKGKAESASAGAAPMRVASLSRLGSQKMNP